MHATRIKTMLLVGPSTLEICVIDLKKSQYQDVGARNGNTIILIA
jgi:hypothetical protein